ncbi:hypothetical protein ACWC19_39295, partial [Streptomyces sp. 900105245]
AHPDVYDVLVAGVPDATWGNHVAAVVQLREGAGPAVVLHPFGPGGLGVPQHHQTAHRAGARPLDHARVPRSRGRSRASSRSA